MSHSSSRAHQLAEDFQRLTEDKKPRDSPFLVFQLGIKEGDTCPIRRQSVTRGNHETHTHTEFQQQ